MTADEYISLCEGICGTVVDKPFEEDFETHVARHADTRRWYALLMKLDGQDVVNLKCEPMESDFLRQAYVGITPAWHMNKVHWNSVYLDSDVPAEEILRLTEKSFALTDKVRKGAPRKKTQK